MQISVIVTTYNRPKALDITLNSLQQQTNPAFEIIVADDGSDYLTQKILNKYPQIKHIWHEDNGFQAASIRNKAVAKSTGDYLIFIDGDVVVFPDFIKQHGKLAETGYFVAGNRILLNATLTKQWEEKKNNPLQWNKIKWINARFNHTVNRLSPLIRLSTQAAWRKKKPKQWQKARTCNLAVAKSDFLAINGFDEAYQGWGHEDADLAIRLIHNKVYRKDGRFAVPVLHLWHPDNSRHNEQENWKRLQKRIANTQMIKAKKGVDQYIS